MQTTIKTIVYLCIAIFVYIILESDNLTHIFTSLFLLLPCVLILRILKQLNN